MHGPALCADGLCRNAGSGCCFGVIFVVRLLLCFLLSFCFQQTGVILFSVSFGTLDPVRVLCMSVPELHWAEPSRRQIQQQVCACVSCLVHPRSRIAVSATLPLTRRHTITVATSLASVRELSMLQFPTFCSSIVSLPQRFDAVGGRLVLCQVPDRCECLLFLQHHRPRIHS